MSTTASLDPTSIPVSTLGTSTSPDTLSTGAKITISIGIPILAVILLIGLFFWHGRRRRSLTTTDPIQRSTFHELDAEKAITIVELDFRRNTCIAELEAPMAVYSAKGGWTVDPVELPGDSYRWSRKGG